METSQVQSELSYIKSVMEQSRPNLIIDGWHFIMWGILVFFGLANTYFAILSGAGSQIYYAWIFIIAFGWICSFLISWYQKKKGMRKKVRTINERHVASISTACGFAMVILGFVAPLSGVYSSYAICPCMAAVLGIMYFLIGSIVDNKMIKYIGYIWWAGSAGLFVMVMDKTLRPESLLAYAFLVLALQVIPGFILNKKFQAAKATV